MKADRNQRGKRTAGRFLIINVEGSAFGILSLLYYGINIIPHAMLAPYLNATKNQITFSIFQILTENCVSNDSFICCFIFYPFSGACVFRHVLLSVHEWILWLIFIVRTYYF